jgi:hypothetical protein
MPASTGVAQVAAEELEGALAVNGVRPDEPLDLAPLRQLEVGVVNRFEKKQVEGSYYGCVAVPFRKTLDSSGVFSGCSFGGNPGGK